jgi:orotate phosphoribosyltransferase
MPDARTQLIEYLARFAYKYSKEKPFLLASGAYSEEYLDCRLALSQPGAMVALGSVFLNNLKPGIMAIGGLTMGSDPIAMSTCMTSATGGRSVRWFTVRKEAKAHGQRKLVEGSVTAGELVAVVDDVVTSGSSTIKAIEACKAHGLRIAQVTVLVDRQQLDGLENIRKATGPGIDVSAICTKEEIKSRWMELNPHTQKHCDNA